MSALPIFPGRRQPSIFGASELNCRVRDGNGWTLTAISTDCVAASFISFASACGQSSLISLRLLPKSKPLRWVLILLLKLLNTASLPIEPASLGFDWIPWNRKLPIVRCGSSFISTNFSVKIFFTSPGVSPLQGSGTPSGTRTLDTLIKSQVLYQLS